MAAQQFVTDPDGLRAAGESFDGIGNDLTAAAKTLKETLKALDTPWGGDTFGEALAMIYDPIKEGMDESMPHLGEELQKIGKSLGTMADNYQQSDEDTDSSILRLGAQRPSIAL
jgi:uncharacterized protein YukE